ncbi:unnamed protein product, partial [Discosporangium mesarthrocarpum]
RHKSAILYFPHLELLFLLMTYQGASAAEASMLQSECLPFQIVGVVAMFIFPVCLLLYVTRVVWMRVRPENGPVEFFESPGDERGFGCCCSNLFRGIYMGWKNGSSVFEWADKGAWRCRRDETVYLEERKFRIGFEPLFVDYTHQGAIYVVFLLFKWLAMGVIAG